MSLSLFLLTACDPINDLSQDLVVRYMSDTRDCDDNYSENICKCQNDTLVVDIIFALPLH